MFVILSKILWTRNTEIIFYFFVSLIFSALLCFPLFSSLSLLFSLYHCFSLFLFCPCFPLYFLLVSVFFVSLFPSFLSPLVFLSVLSFFFCLFLIFLFFLSGYDNSCHMMLLKIINSKIVKTVLEECLWFSLVLPVCKTFPRKEGWTLKERHELQCWK